MLSDIDLPKIPDGYRWKFYKGISGHSIIALQKRKCGVWFDVSCGFPSVYEYKSSIEGAIRQAAEYAYQKAQIDIKYSKHYGTHP